MNNRESNLSEIINYHVNNKNIAGSKEYYLGLTNILEKLPEQQVYESLLFLNKDGLNISDLVIMLNEGQVHRELIKNKLLSEFLLAIQNKDVKKLFVKMMDKEEIPITNYFSNTYMIVKSIYNNKHYIQLLEKELEIRKSAIKKITARFKSELSDAATPNEWNNIEKAIDKIESIGGVFGKELNEAIGDVMATRFGELQGVHKLPFLKLVFENGNCQLINKFLVSAATNTNDDPTNLLFAYLDFMQRNNKNILPFVISVLPIDQINDELINKNKLINDILYNMEKYYESRNIIKSIDTLNEDVNFRNLIEIMEINNNPRFLNDFLDKLASDKHSLDMIIALRSFIDNFDFNNTSFNEIERLLVLSRAVTNSHNNYVYFRALQDLLKPRPTDKQERMLEFVYNKILIAASHNDFNLSERTLQILNFQNHNNLQSNIIRDEFHIAFQNLFSNSLINNQEQVRQLCESFLASNFYAAKVKEHHQLENSFKNSRTP